MKYAFFIILGISSFICKSQETLLEGKIDYVELYEYGAIERHTLFFNSNESLYRQVIDENRQNQTVEDNGDGTFKVTFAYHLDTPEYVHYDLKNRELLFRQVSGIKLFTVTDSLETINWSLRNETKKIGNFTCQRATGEFRGRSYSVWFTNEIPVPFGPWKLNGLGGIILEASDDTGHYRVLAEKIVLDLVEGEFEEKKNIIEPDKLISFQEYKETIQIQHEETIRYINSRLPKGSSLTSAKGKGWYSMEMFQ